MSKRCGSYPVIWIIGFWGYIMYLCVGVIHLVDLEEVMDVGWFGWVHFAKSKLVDNIGVLVKREKVVRKVLYVVEIASIEYSIITRLITQLKAKQWDRFIKSN